jgi:hypothetical protein
MKRMTTKTFDHAVVNHAFTRHDLLHRTQERLLGDT